MRMLFNASILRSEGGVALLLQFIDSFLTQDVQLKILLYLNPELVDRILGPLGERFGKRLEVVPFRPGEGLKRFWWEQVTLPGIIREEQIEVLFSFSNTGPLFPGCRQILYIQQSIPYARFTPKEHQSAWRRFCWQFRTLVALAQWGSQRIIVQTAWIIPALRESVWNSIPMSRYVVSLPGLPEPACETVDASGCEALIARLDSLKGEGRFLLFYPTFLAPYKQIPYLLKALSLLKQQQPDRVSLVLTISEDSREYFPCREEIFETIQRLDLDWPELVLTGSLSRTQVSACYERCDALVFPSVVETLGIPLLEAMAQKIPIVAVDKAYAREVCGSAALYADPDNPQAMAECVEALMNDQILRHRLIQNAETQLTCFNWRENARRILSEEPVL